MNGAFGARYAGRTPVAVNTSSGEEVCIPRSFVGDVSANAPVVIVSLNRELEWRDGIAVPYSRPVVELPLAVNDCVPVVRPHRPAPVVSIRLEPRAPVHTGRKAVVVVMLGVVAAAIVADAVRPGEMRDRIDAMRVSRVWQQLKPGDDYSAVVAKLGQPGAQRTYVDDNGVVFRSLDYPSRRFTAILEGRTAGEARYVGSLDARGRVLGNPVRVLPATGCVPYPVSDNLNFNVFLTTSGLDRSACGAAICLGAIALSRNEHINSLWLVAAAACTYLVGYRFYGKLIAARVMALDDRRATPAELLDNGHDFVPTNKWIAFGHHFAAIAGPGPLVGPVVAAQFGYLPGTLWIIAGAVLGGAVQDFVILFASMRRDGKSLGQMAREEIGKVGGFVSADHGADDCMIVLLAVVALRRW